VGLCAVLNVADADLVREALVVEVDAEALQLDSFLHGSSFPVVLNSLAAQSRASAPTNHPPLLISAEVSCCAIPLGHCSGP
jgi:hypothetical protein